MSTRKSRNKRFFAAKDKVYQHPVYGAITMLDDWDKRPLGHFAMARVKEGDAHILCQREELLSISSGLYAKKKKTKVYDSESRGLS